MAQQNMSEDELRRTLARNIESTPGIRGINNHMGSLLTRHPGHMAWLMAELNNQNINYFIDSRTTQIHHGDTGKEIGEIPT